MNRTLLNSSNIISAGYYDHSQTLEIEFHNGGIYQYFNVPRAIYDQLLTADSPGGFLYEYIRGVFRYARL